eukprot:5513338-Pleurochrysis_carterae.AAC.1
MLLQLRTLYKLKTDGRQKARCVLGGHHLQQGRDFDRTFSPTVKHTTLRLVTLSATLLRPTRRLTGRPTR